MAEERATREKSEVKLSDLMGKPLEATGVDIAEGSHPGTLFGFSEPFLLPNNFAKPGQPVKRLVFDMRFGVYDKDGILAEVTYLVPAPETGKIHRLSNLFKAMRSLGTGDAGIIDGDDIAVGFTLDKLIGKRAVLNVKKNERGFPSVDSIGGPMKGAKYPSVEECQEKLRESPGIPF